MSTKRQPRGPKMVYNERVLEEKQQAAGSTTPSWIRTKKNDDKHPQTHPLTAIRENAKGKVEAKEEIIQARSNRAAKRSSKDNKENAKGSKRRAKAAPQSPTGPEREPSPTTKRIYVGRQQAPPPEEPEQDEATGSGRSSQQQHATPTPACITEEEFASWLAAQPGQTVPAEQHCTLLNEFRKLRHKYEELKAARWDEIMPLFDMSILDAVKRDARALADHWRQECDQQAALAREAGTADLQHERDTALEKHQQLATDLAEAVNGRAAALLRAAAAERELAAHRGRVMATTGVQTTAVEFANHGVQAPAGNPMRLQLMPEGLEGSLHSSMPAKGVMVPATTTPGGTVQGAAQTPTTHGVPRSSVRMPTPASAPQRLGQGSPSVDSPLGQGSHPAFPPSRQRTSRLRRTTLAGPVQGDQASELRQPRFDSRDGSSEFPDMSLATSAQGSGGTVAPVKTPGKNTPFGMMTGLERVKEDGESMRVKHPRTGFVYELKKVNNGDQDMFAYRYVQAGTLAGLADQLPSWLFQEICFGADQRETFLANLFEALKAGS